MQAGADNAFFTAQAVSPYRPPRRLPPGGEVPDYFAQLNLENREDGTIPHPRDVENIVTAHAVDMNIAEAIELCDRRIIRHNDLAHRPPRHGWNDDRHRDGHLHLVHQYQFLKRFHEKHAQEDGSAFGEAFDEIPVIRMYDRALEEMDIISATEDPARLDEVLNAETERYFSNRRRQIEQHNLELKEIPPPPPETQEERDNAIRRSFYYDIENRVGARFHRVYGGEDPVRIQHSPPENEGQFLL
jgi:hypothetical protein